MLDWVTAPFTSLKHFMDLGGWVIQWIFVACLVMWTLIAERWWYFNRILPREVQDCLKHWETRREHRSWFARNVRQTMISRLNAGMNANMQLLRVLVPLAPLLGLLGTVSGMLEVFGSMAARGNADARSMAEGVSEAMLCTLSGLGVSISGLFPIYRFQQRIRLETELLADKFAF